MPSQHKYPAISFRPPEGDRSWLLEYARQTGQPVNRILAEALSIYRSGHEGLETAGSERRGGAMSGDLTEFLCARLDEVEAAANAVAGAALDAHWTPESIAEDERTRVARYGPARVLREVEAKRRIVEDYRIAASAVMRTENASDSMYAGRDAFRSACVTLAGVYSDYPDYRQQWKP